ncbi:MAG: hypothetical protein MI892_15175 [Desulfobacterales bacterium]|nr:hypothetical protein [Desulfobacterales bacterium]
MLFEQFPFIETDDDLRHLLPQYHAATLNGEKQGGV